MYFPNFPQLTSQFITRLMKGDDQYRPSYDMVKRLQQEVILAKPDAR